MKTLHVPQSAIRNRRDAVDEPETGDEPEPLDEPPASRNAGQEDKNETRRRTRAIAGEQSSRKDGSRRDGSSRGAAAAAPERQRESAASRRGASGRGQR